MNLQIPGGNLQIPARNLKHGGQDAVTWRAEGAASVGEAATWSAKVATCVIEPALSLAVVSTSAVISPAAQHTCMRLRARLRRSIAHDSAPAVDDTATNNHPRESPRLVSGGASKDIRPQGELHRCALQ